MKLDHLDEVSAGPTRASQEIPGSALAGRVFSVPAWLITAVLVVGTVVVYWPAIHFKFIHFDDPDYVSANPHVLGGLTPASAGWAFTTFESYNWHPLTWLSLMLDASLFGKSPAGFHFTNVVLHAVNGVLLFWLLLRLTGAKLRSAWVAAFFAWHPLHVESVAWVSERKDVLSTAFGFLSLLFYARYVQRPVVENAERAGEPPHRTFAWLVSPAYWAAWCCLALGLMSKPMLVTWPFVMLLLDYWPLARFQSQRPWPLILEKIPFLGLALAAGVVTFLVQNHEGAVHPRPLWMHGETAVISCYRYLEKLIWPKDLAVMYPYPGQWPLPLFLLAGAVVAGLSLLLWWQRRRHPLLLVGWLWFLGTLVPVIGLVQVGAQSMADRYVYIPSVGALVLIIWGAHELTWRRPDQQALLSVAGIAALVACLVLTRHQLGYWRDSETLGRHALAVTTNNNMAHLILGAEYLDEGRQDAAAAEIQEAIRLDPSMAWTHFNYAIALAELGRTSSAISEYKLAIQMYPDFTEAFHNLGFLLLRLGQTDAAVPQLQACLRLQPDLAGAHTDLGTAYSRQGRTDAAISEFQTAIRLQPELAEPHYNLAGALLKQGRIDEAITEYQAAIHCAPDYAEAHYYLGVALMKPGRIDEAITEFQAALRLKPDYALACNNLGIALGAKGRMDEAISQFQDAIRLKPDYAAARTNLARALELKNKK